MRSDYQNAVTENFNVNNTQGVLINAKANDRLSENYTNKDQNWVTGSYSGDIYISVSDQTHDLIVNHHNDPNNLEFHLPESGFPGTSGFFTDEATASKYFDEDSKFDSVGLGRELQQSPYFDVEAANTAKLEGRIYYPEYNGHLDCFRVNPDQMQEHFGTTDFYAAMSHCTENTAWGEGGGRQGYNPYINEMINKGALEYVPQNSRTCDYNECREYYSQKTQAQQEAIAVNDHINNNNIVAKDGERLGYNEINHNVNFSANNNSGYAITISSENIASIGGGGANAPNITEADNKSKFTSDTICGKVDTDKSGGFYDAKLPSDDKTPLNNGLNVSNNNLGM